jgi:hypothetical protein
MARHNKARHRLPGRHETTRAVQRTIEMVDNAGTAHFLTIDAAENGKPQGRYTALCAQEIVPGALIAKVARWCPLCIPVPTQRPPR